MNPFLSGDELYGDNFGPTQISKWFADEAEAYANLGAADSSNYKYVYHALNKLFGYQFLDSGNKNALGIGSAYGHEFEPIVDRLTSLAIVEPSTVLNAQAEFGGVPVNYVVPDESGVLPFADATFDLTTSFGVLHHIPNVSFVISEVSRCTAKGGQFLLREPIVSMGDWQLPRAGLTKHERGIPRELLVRFLEEAGFSIERITLFGFQPLVRSVVRLGGKPYASVLVTRMDRFLSRLFAWNIRYHREKLIHRIAPTSVFIVATKA